MARQPCSLVFNQRNMSLESKAAGGQADSASGCSATSALVASDQSYSFTDLDLARRC